MYVGQLRFNFDAVNNPSDLKIKWPEAKQARTLERRSRRRSRGPPGRGYSSRSEGRLLSDKAKDYEQKKILYLCLLSMAPTSAGWWLNHYKYIYSGGERGSFRGRSLKKLNEPHGSTSKDRTWRNLSIQNV